MDSVLRRKGLTFSVEVARQGGKNEISAQLEVLLLTMHMLRGGSGVKCAPSFVTQTIISMERLKTRLNDAGYGRRWKAEHGYIIRLGKARQLFFSADKSANVVGATADLLLEIDEAQDVDKEKYHKEFRPMGASANVTTVLYGTPWNSETLLEEQKQANLELERRDGLRRHFRFDWKEVARFNPDYRRFVEAEKARLGESHPLYRTQYCLEPLRGGYGFLDPQQLAWLQGVHPRQHQPRRGEIYVAGVDVAGEAAEGSAALDGGPGVRAREPRRDSTVVTIARVNYAGTTELLPEPVVEVVEHVWWTGRNYASLIGELAGLLRETWRCRRVVVDATGLGAGLASTLERLLGSSVARPYVFTAASKSKLGFNLMAAVNAHCLKLYTRDGSEECREFWQEIERAQSHYRSNQQMAFYVDAREGHDDFLMSLALTVEAAKLYTPRNAKGRV